FRSALRPFYPPVRLMQDLQDARPLELLKGGHRFWAFFAMHHECFWYYLRSVRGHSVDRSFVPSIRQLEGWSGRNDGRSADHVLQFAHIARPAVCAQCFNHFIRYLPKTLPQSPPGFV